MCLMIIKQLKTWEDARSICKRKGGDLTWINNDAELEAIGAQLFQESGEKKFVWFHIGLFRKEEGAPLQWTGGSKSQYRGGKFVDVKKLHFSTFAPNKYKYIDGDERGVLLRSVCRR